VTLTERDAELGHLAARVDAARAGAGSMVLVCGESGAGKTSFVEEFVAGWARDDRVLWGACDPLPTPRPLGPVHDLADLLTPATRQVLESGDKPYDIFAAVFDDVKANPSLLVLDDLHWADQATIDLLRFVLRRIGNTRSLAIGTVRDDEVGVTHPLRALLGDAARSPHASTISLPALSPAAVSDMAAGRSIDPVRLHRITGGNPFFVCEMLDHDDGDDDLPTTVRDAILARTAGLDTDAWDVLHLLACAPGSIPDHLLTDLGVTLPALRSVADAGLTRRSDRGVAFRHDLCRLAILSALPPGSRPHLHRRLIDALEASLHADPAVVMHHALGAGDRDRVRKAAAAAGRAAARSGAHAQAAAFFSTALDSGGVAAATDEAELLELLAWECYLLEGHHESAAELFQQLSTPYDAALALADLGDIGCARRALDILDRVGADAVAAELRRELRSRGLTAVPARRRTATFANAAGLTARQVDVLRLLGDGLTNAELAERLFLSIKTVDHHVSAILAKLEVTKRREAVRRARELSILP
jgi:predicted ATPase/DNA-binding CsgD family transcriptional regulator